MGPLSLKKQFISCLVAFAGVGGYAPCELGVRSRNLARVRVCARGGAPPQSHVLPVRGETRLRVAACTAYKCPEGVLQGLAPWGAIRHLGGSGTDR